LDHTNIFIYCIEVMVKRCVVESCLISLINCNNSTKEG